MPGRNLAVIIETAAINNRQKEMGYNAAKELLKQLGLNDDANPPVTASTAKKEHHFMQMIADLTPTYTVRYPRIPNPKRDGGCRQRLRLQGPRHHRSRARHARCAPHRWHFENPTALPRTIDGMVMLYGAEANVVDAKGHLDLPPRILEYQDWVVASIHSPCVPGLLTRKEVNRIWLAVAENPYVDCIGHSEQENYRYDYDLVTKAFAANHKVVELNGNSFNVRKDGIPNMKALLAACLQNGCHIAVDSDAHSTWQLRHGLTALYGMLEEMNFPGADHKRYHCKSHSKLKLHGKACAEEVEEY